MNNEPFKPDEDGRLWDWDGQERDPITHEWLVRDTVRVWQDQLIAPGEYPGDFITLHVHGPMPMTDPDMEAPIAGLLLQRVIIIEVEPGDYWEPPVYEPDIIEELRVPARYRCWGKGV